MGLTSLGTLAVVALLAVAAPAGCLLVWNRLGRRSWVRLSARAGLLLICQTSAVLLVGLLVNNQYLFYTSWSELFGQPSLIASAAPVPTHRVDHAYARELRAAYFRGHGTVIPWVIPGGSSGLPSLHALV